MPYFNGGMNSKDNYGETNRVPPGSNEEKVKAAAQRTTGTDAVIKNKMGDASETASNHDLGYYDTLN